MGAITKTMKEMPDIVITLLITFALLMMGGIFMYKSADVSTDIITNTTHQAEISARADSFNTSGDSVVSVVDVLVGLVVIFVLFALIFYLVKALRSKGGVEGI